MEMSERPRSNLKLGFTRSSSRISPGSTIYSGLRTSLSLLKETADATELPVLKGAVGGLLKVVEVIERMAQNQDDAKELLDYLKSLENLLDTQNPRIPESLARRIEELSQELINIVQDIQKIKCRGRVVRFMRNDADASALARHVQAINRIFFKFQVGSSVSLERQMMVVTENVTKIGQGLVQADLPRVVKARFDGDNRKGCLEGTRVALLEIVRSWAQQADPHSASLFWLCGQAGTGKTTICSSVADSCHERGRLGASFFFSRDHEDRSDIRRVFPTIAHQFGSFCGEFKELVSVILKKDPDLAYIDPAHQLEKLIINPLKVCTSFPHDTVVVIDALDECKDEEPISTVLSILSDNRFRLPQLKFFISSRPEENIHLGFEPLQEITQSLILHDIDASIVDADIELYLRKGLVNASRIYRHIVERDWPPDEVIKSLVQKSSRLFIFAATALNFILDRNYSDPIRQLEVLLEESRGIESSSSPFFYLDQLYLKVLHQAFPDSTPPDHFTLLRMVLGAIVLLRNPLSPGDLESLLGLRRGVIRTTLRHLHSIMIVPDTDEQAIRLIHPSFFDFATTRCPDPQFCINLSLYHEELAIFCFKQMKRMKRDICEIKDSSKLNEEIEDLPERIERYIPPALQYACHHWVYHVGSAGESTSLQTSVNEFCHGQLLYWIEVLSLLGSLRDGIRHLQVLQKHLTNYSFIPEGLLAILNDTVLFIPEYFEVISSASLQLYRYALPLSSPSNSLRQAFSYELRGGVHVLQRAGEQKHSGVTILRGHSNYVRSAGLSPDGTLVVSAGYDEVRLWDRGTGTLLKTLTVDSSVNSYIVWANFCLDGERVISGTEQASIYIWDGTSGVCLKTIKLEGAYKRVSSYTCSPDVTRIVGSAGRDILIWDISNGSLLATLMGHDRDVRSVAFSPNHELIASTADFDDTIRLWDAVSGTALKTLTGHFDSVMAVAFSPCSKYIVSGSWDCDLRLWDISRGITSRIFKGHTELVCSVAFSGDGTQIISGSRHGQLQVWNAIEGKLLKTLSVGNVGLVKNVGFSFDGSHYICTEYRAIYIWDADRDSELDRSEGQLINVKFSPDGTHLIGIINSIPRKPDIHLWDGLTGAPLKVLKGHCPILSLAFSPNNQYIASVCQDDSIQLWDTSRTALKTLRGHSDKVTSVVFSPSSTQIVSTSNDEEVRMWDTTSGNNIFTVEANHGAAYFSPDGSQIIADAHHRYEIPPHLRSHPVPLNNPVPNQLWYSIDGGWIFASRGDKKERCIWLPVDWRSYNDISSSGRVAIGTRYGLVLLDLSGINLSI